MTCEHGWVRHGPSTMVQLSPVTFPRFYFYHACWGRQEYLLAEMCGFCEPSRRRVAEVTCKARPATCVTAFPTSPAARRWADCNDIATLRKRGEAYERAWVKAAARELDMMIEIQRLRKELAASKCAACCGTGLVAGEWLIDPTDPRYDNPPLCPCQNLENSHE